MAQLKPASTFIPARSPIADKDGMATWSFIKILQDWDTKLRNGLNSDGLIIGDIPPTTQIIGRTAIGDLVQYIDDGGVVTGPGIDFARAYLNKDTDHIADGNGSPLAGGKVAYAALVASTPAAGKTIRFNGTDWLPVAIAVTKTPVSSQWLRGYDSSTGAFTASQPNFTDIAGQITTAQLPTGTISGTITTAKLTGGGTNGSMTFTNGVLTASTPAT